MRLKDNLNDVTIRKGIASNLIWFNIGTQIHHANGPSDISSSGRTEYLLWGNLHNEKGPAVVDQYGNIMYFLDNKELTKEEWQNAT